MLLFMSVFLKNINNFDTYYRNTYKNVQRYYTLRNARIRCTCTVDVFYVMFLKNLKFNKRAKRSHLIFINNWILRIICLYKNVYVCILFTS